ncbi:MAG: hypothetical protein A3H69_05795 [Candidatus Sungbacteria bacterium RIFCSPLOWO2_02_FULL_47_9]|uniref:Uncharacterized protein n=1 Tax=Candidatus Sungbacteria bacterium RIFCSPHIGHO2_01_FULL_47_32 TaxID=1802264 RepID=A0A1G2K2G3_9BACT|nr:MAG: hypothetical protein A2633_04570 [Candidatus Sungbacteria bacterium RIFCSPHIGHO2_01_FULL_47_32]OHA05444.1 MAG: hypothetical protein A3A28_03030 [Candidatus Sungbacteria bacterium RIFCSPLOWO2_01_FULL_47_32]OHA08660.1 MAG: hypothetical protein A3H69_05795 [Candidatus Sungbacteria bacterium RIFCSPLOWO2_02_FULL_47_9]
MSPDNTRSVYSNPIYGLSFQYPKKYFLEEKEVGTAIRAYHVLTLTLDSVENKRIREGKIAGFLPFYTIEPDYARRKVLRLIAEHGFIRLQSFITTQKISF